MDSKVRKYPRIRHWPLCRVCPRICIALALLSCCPLGVQGSSNKLDPSNRLSRVEASIFAESALIDKETGRIYWEAGGSQSTLSKSVLSKFGLGPHFKATVLSLILLLSILGHFHGWLRRKLDESELFYTFLQNRYLFLPTLLLKHVCLGAPRFETWFIAAIVVLYFCEAYTCKTYKYLSNPINSPEEVESYIEQLRHQPPIVSWKIRSFHYESSIWYQPKLLWKVVAAAMFPRKSEFQRIDTNSTAHLNKDIDVSRYTFWPIGRKRVTHQGDSSYEYTHWEDSTMVGLWQRARALTSSFPHPSMPSHGAPFAKLNLSKLLVLSDAKARKAYFEQQSKFISEHSVEDDLAEFSTKIEVPGFQPRLLAVRSPKHDKDKKGPQKVFSVGAISFQFWLFTLLGLTVPYRIWFNQHCDELRVTVVKETFARSPGALSLSNDSGSRWWSWSGWSLSSATATANKNVDDNVDQKEVFRETMRKLNLYKPKKAVLDDSTPLIEPVKKMIRHFAPKALRELQEEDDESNSSKNATAATRSMIVEEMRSAVAAAELLNTNKTLVVQDVVPRSGSDTKATAKTCDEEMSEEKNEATDAPGDSVIEAGESCQTCNATAKN